MDDSLLKEIYKNILAARLLEQKLIHLQKKGESYFWIGGPGEEIFYVCLAFLLKIGQGIKYDYSYLHYRSAAFIYTLSQSFKDSIRLSLSTASDPCTGGRNFSSHYSYKKWNIPPIHSIIETQYLFALGTAYRQKKEKTDSITVVTGGDGGSAQGDFNSCLMWASRKNKELPLLITVQNNKWAISTSYKEERGEEKISDRGKVFGIKSKSFNGCDIFETYESLKEHITYVRKNRKPALLEAYVSRLYGHSSSSGANRVKNEIDPLEELEKVLNQRNLLKDKKKIETSLSEKLEKEYREVLEEKNLKHKSVWDHVYAHNENANWRHF